MLGEVGALDELNVIVVMNCDEKERAFRKENRLGSNQNSPLRPTLDQVLAKESFEKISLKKFSEKHFNNTLTRWPR